MSTAVAIRSVTKRLGATLVLDDISLDIPAGRTTAVLGESGCGKTTVLRCINGLLRPDAGKINLFGAPLDYERLPELRQRMGYAVQAVGLFPHLRLAENLALVARLADWSEARINERRRQLMRAMELSEDLAGRYPHELSGGQRQRFGICRAMMLKPDLLLLDEPFSGVDPIGRVRIHHELLDLLRDEPATAVLVTHDVHEALRLASHLIVMAGGRILQQDDVETMLNAPTSDYVAHLFSEQLDDVRTRNGAGK